MEPQFHTPHNPPHNPLPAHEPTLLRWVAAANGS